MIVTLTELNTIIVIVNVLLATLITATGMNWLLKNQHLKIVGLKLNTYE